MVRLNFHRALGILLLKMFADSLFTGLKGTGKRQVEDFEMILGRRLKEMRESVGKDDVSEEIHHVELACELIQACLEKRPEDRWVRVKEGYGMRGCSGLN